LSRWLNPSPAVEVFNFNALSRISDRSELGLDQLLADQADQLFDQVKALAGAKGIDLRVPARKTPGARNPGP